MIFSSAFSVLEILVSGSIDFEKLPNIDCYAISEKVREKVYPGISNPI